MDIDWWPIGEDLHFAFFLDNMSKGDRLPVDLDGADLGVRHAKRFNEIFDGGAAIQWRGKQPVAASDSLDEGRQPAVEADVDGNDLWRGSWFLLATGVHNLPERSRNGLTGERRRVQGLRPVRRKTG